MSGPRDVHPRCRDFRARLERALLGRSSEGEMRALEWHEHLLGCSACRALLEAEQALEELLASLPRPRLSAEATQRVLACLRARREADEADEAALDELLALDDAAPLGEFTAGELTAGELAAGVLAGLAGERGTAADAGAGTGALDRLLERDRVEAPEGLAERVRAALAAERAAPAGAGGDDRLDPLLDRFTVAVPLGLAGRVRAAVAAERAPRPVLSWTRVAAALAAGLLAVLGLWLWEPAGGRPYGADDDELARVESMPDVPEDELLAELLAERVVFEHFELLERAESDIDVLLQMELDPEDEALLAYGEGSATDGPDAR